MVPGRWSLLEDESIHPWLEERSRETDAERDIETEKERQINQGDSEAAAFAAATAGRWSVTGKRAAAAAAAGASGGWRW